MQAFDSNNKIDFVLVQAFPANEVLSKGIFDILNRYFNVHFLNLPGFHSSEAPIDGRSIDDYVTNIEERIDALNLDKFVLAGISFGFLLINKANISKEKLYYRMGFAPFLGISKTKLTKKKVLLLKVLTSSVCKLHIENRVWNNQVSYYFAKRLFKDDDLVLDEIFRSTQPKSFFEVLHYILTFKGPIEFKDSNYVLYMNPNDETVDYMETFDYFKKGVPPSRLKVVNTNLPHFPKDLSTEFFEKTVTKAEIDKIVGYVNNWS